MAEMSVSFLFRVPLSCPMTRLCLRGAHGRAWEDPPEGQGCWGRGAALARCALPAPARLRLPQGPWVKGPCSLHMGRVLSASVSKCIWDQQCVPGSGTGPVQSLVL